MTNAEWLEFIEFCSKELYFLVAFMCGIILGYMVGFKNGGDL
jgi:hypothetical protein